MKAQQAPPASRQVWLVTPSPGPTLLNTSQFTSGGMVLYASHRIRMVSSELNQELNRCARIQPSGPSESAGGLSTCPAEVASAGAPLGAWPCNVALSAMVSAPPRRYVCCTSS